MLSGAIQHSLSGSDSLPDTEVPSFKTGSLFSEPRKAYSISAHFYAYSGHKMEKDNTDVGAASGVRHDFLFLNSLLKTSWKQSQMLIKQACYPYLESK